MSHPEMSTAEFDQTQAAIRDELDRLVAWAVEHDGNFTTKDATIRLTGYVAMSTRTTAWPLLITEAVIRLATAQGAK